MAWKSVSAMEQRLEFLKSWISGEKTVSELCQEFDISRTAGHKLIRRYKQEGFAAIRERSRRPIHQSRQLSNTMVCDIIALRSAHPRWGGEKIRAVMARTMSEQELPCVRTIDRLLARAGLVQRRNFKPKRSYQVESIIKPKEPNDVWTVDFKGPWTTRDGKRCLPLTIRDEYSRYLLDLTALKFGGTEDVKKRFIRCFEEHGLPRYIRSDNGTPFASVRAVCGLTNLSVWWVKLGIFPNRIPPGCPQLNGGHERMHRDIKEELQRNPARNLRVQQDVFDQWREDFNNERPHKALGLKTPANVYKPSSRSYKEALKPFNYDPRLELRHVCSRGFISWRCKKLHVASGLAGEAIGIEPHPELLAVDLWFRKLYLGRTDMDFTHPLGGEWVSSLTATV